MNWFLLVTEFREILTIMINNNDNNSANKNKRVESFPKNKQNKV